MRTQRLYWLIVLAIGTLPGCGQTSPPAALSWVGTWAAEEPAHGGELRCSLNQLDGERWEGKFTGYCDRQFAYEVAMQGRRDGSAIQFNGEADLGEKDGGVFRWTGRIVGEEFVGEYHSTAGKTGKFQMKPVRE